MKEGEKGEKKRRRRGRNLNDKNYYQSRLINYQLIGIYRNIFIIKISLQNISIQTKFLFLLFFSTGD